MFYYEGSTFNKVMRETLAHLFRPRKSNKHRSKFLHPDSLVYLTIISIGIFALVKVVSFFPSIGEDIISISSALSAEKIIQGTNLERRKRGLDKLEYNEQLTEAAYEKALDMYEQQYWAHVAPDGTAPWDFIKQNSYQYRVAGENLARDFDNNQDVIDAWMNSTTHRDNIVGEKFTDIGVAVVPGKLLGSQTTLVVQLFGSTSQTLADKTATDSASILGKQIALGQEKLESHPLFTPLQIIKAFFLALLVMIIWTLFYDQIIYGHSKQVRLVGSNIGHVLLFCTVAFLLIFFRSGSII